MLNLSEINFRKDMIKKLSVINRDKRGKTPGGRKRMTRARVELCSERKWSIPSKNE